MWMIIFKSNAYIVTTSVMSVILIILWFANLMSINMYRLKHGKFVIAGEWNNLQFIAFLCYERMLFYMSAGVRKLSSSKSADERQVIMYINI